MDYKNKSGLSEKEYMEQYDASHFDRLSVAADMVIFTVGNKEEENYRKLPEKNLKILLIKRGEHPYTGKWALPGGFVRNSETTDEAAIRELKEETGIDNVYMEQLYTFSDPNRDPRTRVISCSYMALIDSSQIALHASDDAIDTAWFTVSYKLKKEQREITDSGVIETRIYLLQLEKDDTKLLSEIEIVKSNSKYELKQITSEGLAFDHGKIITYGIERLRNKIEYTNIALNLMSTLFTLTDLQKVYEIILDKKLLKANFRRKVANLVEETDLYAENAGHRPSKLFKRNI